MFLNMVLTSGNSLYFDVSWLMMVVSVAWTHFTNVSICKYISFSINGYSCSVFLLVMGRSAKVDGVPSGTRMVFFLSICLRMCSSMYACMF